MIPEHGGPSGDERSDVPARTASLTADRLAIVVAYVLSWALLLVNRGLYWDDWTLVGQSPESLLRSYGELGMPWFAAFYAPLLALPLPGLVGHVLVFFAYLASSLVLHAIVLRIPGLGRLDAVVIALVFAVFPVNYARVALIDLPYGLCLLAFLAATWLLIRQVESGGLVRRVSSLVLFACSFFTASLLVLYALPIGLAAFVRLRSAPGSFRRLVPAYLDFLALPVVYWLIKSAVFRPSGIYTGYNALTVPGLLAVPRAMLAIPGEVVVEPVQRAAVLGGLAGLVAGVVAAAWLIRRSARESEATGLLPAPVLALAGIVLVAVGVFAYLAVGQAPVIWDWSSRHQLLVPLGAGVIAAAIVRLGRVRRRTNPVFAGIVGLLIGVSIVANARTLVAYQADWFKQVALMDAVPRLPAARTAHHILVTDAARSLDALRRTYRFYEYNALFERALGGRDRLVAGTRSQPRAADLERFIERPAYHMEDYVPSPVDLDLRIAPGSSRLGLFETLKLVALETLGSPSFGPEVSQVIDVTAEPVSTGTGLP